MSNMIGHLTEVKISKSLKIGILCIVLVLLLSIHTRVTAQNAPQVMGSISGRVTDMAGQPIANAQVNIYLSTNSFYKSVNTDVAGNYQVDGVVTGMYILKFTDQANRFLEQYYQGAERFDNAQIISVVGNNVQGIDVMLVPASTINGAISLIPDLGVAYTYVNLDRREASGNWQAAMRQEITLQPNETKPFHFELLKQGLYRISVFPVLSNLLLPAEYFDNSLTPENAKVLSLGDGSNITDVNIILGENPNSGAIQGAVTDLSGIPIPEIRVTIAKIDATYGQYSATTGADGKFYFYQIMPGTYRVQFSESTYFGSSHYLDQYFNNAHDVESATSLEVITGTVLTGINARLVKAGAIAGSVRFFDGPAPSDKYYSLYSASNQFREPIRQFSTSGYSGSDSYQINDLLPGTYRLMVSTKYQETTLEKFYDDVTTLEAAKDIVVTEGVVTKGVDFQLGDINNASKISGKVLNENGAPLTNILVSANFSNSYYPIEQTLTDSNGDYHFYLLKPGDYLVRFSDTTLNYYSQYYYDSQLSSLAKPLHVITGSIFSDINAVLTPTASISGTVTLFNGVKPDSAYIELYRAIGNSWERVEYQSGYNLPNPNALGFRFIELDPGIYRIGATHGYLSEIEFYDKKPTLESATNITISSNSIISNVNFVLGQDLANATIAGQVTFSNGLPDNLRIELYRVNSTFDPKNVFVFLRPDAGGKFKIAGLDEGQYRVAMRYSSNNGSTITRIYWPAAEALEQASIITLANDTSANDVNFAVSQIYLPIISNESATGK